MDLILHSGNILTLDARRRRAQAVAVRGGRIAAVGSRDEVLALATPSTRAIDLGGRTVIPGIIDSHNHLPTAGAAMEGVLLFGCRTMGELQERVAARARCRAPGEWIEGYGWIECQFDENRAPTRRELDDAAPDRPVVLHRLFGMAVANSAALKAVGMADNATGLVKSPATRAFRKAARPASEAEALQREMARIERAGREYLRYGITSVVDPGVSPETMRAYHACLKEGRLPLRVNMMPVWHGLYAADEDPEALNRKAREYGVMEGFGDPWLRLGALKMAIDGGLGSRTAAMNEPWLDGTAQVQIRLDIARLNEYIQYGHDLGWSIGIHCCGDRAQDLAVQAFARAQERNPRPNARHNIIHGYFCTPGSLELMKRHGIAVSAQPTFIYIEGDVYEGIVSYEMLTRYKPLRTYHENGIVVAINSDMTSSHYNPWWNAYAACARKTARGWVLGEGEAVDRETMLQMLIPNGAWLTYEEAIKGTIEAGKLADFAVIDRDPSTCPTEDLLGVQTLMTIVDGQVVYDRDRDGPPEF